MTRPRKKQFRQFREDWAQYAELLSYLKPYKFRLFVGIATGFLFAALNSSIPLIIKQVGELVFPSGFEQSKVIEAVGAADGPGVETVIWTASLVPVVMVLRGLVSYVNGYQMSWLTLRVLNDIRYKLFTRITGQGMDFFDKAVTGRLMSRVMNDTKVAQSTLAQLTVNLFKQPIALLFGLGVVVYIDWRFSLVALVLFPVCIVPVARLARKVRKAGKKEEKLAGQLNVVLQETFAGIKVIKSFSREDLMMKLFGKGTGEQFRNSLRVKRNTELTTPLVEIAGAVGVSLALVYVYMSAMPAAKFLALMAGIFLLYAPAKGLSKIHLQLQKCLAATSSIFALMRQPQTVTDLPGASALGPCRGAIVFEDVSFSYGPQTAALHQIHLQIQPGQRVALVGASGAGKSTLLSLIPRFYDPQAGRVMVDGQDVKALTMESLRRQIGMVTQDTFLFHDTIRNNIAFGRPEASQEEIEEAARLAHAHEFIVAQPAGYETIVGDKGRMLSGGQQQRLAIARALLKNAPVLLLDEATSALDTESERMIQDALEKLSTGKTVVAIAHRLSTVLHSDLIVVMHGGRIAATGRHEQLLGTSEIYRELYQLQFHHTAS